MYESIKFHLFWVAFGPLFVIMIMMVVSEPIIPMLAFGLVFGPTVLYPSYRNILYLTRQAESDLKEKHPTVQIAWSTTTNWSEDEAECFSQYMNKRITELWQRGHHDEARQRYYEFIGILKGLGYNLSETGERRYAFLHEEPSALHQLGLPSNATRKDVKRKWRALAKEHHPDRGGSRSTFEKYQQLYQTALSEL